MTPPQTSTFDIAFGLAFDVERDPGRASKFRPAQFDLGAGKDLFGDLRLEGFAALLRTGLTKRLIIVGGNEGRYKGEEPVINRAKTIKLMLECDFGLPADLIQAIPSASNTGGNIAIIKDKIGRSKRGDYAVVSSHYHVPRASMDLLEAGLSMRGIAAEAFLLIEDPAKKESIIERLGGGAYAERVVEEIQGMAHKVLGQYKAKTDATIDRSQSWWQRLRAKV